MNQEIESTENNAVQQCLVSNQNQKCAPQRPSAAKKYIVNCVRKNNKICYSDYQNLVVQDEIPNSEVTDGQDFAEDSIYSGESLYKNLEFDQCQTEAENEKCLAFWKSVMEKNLQPIKCTLLKPSFNDRPLESHDDRRYEQRKKKKGKAKSSKQQQGSTSQSSDEVNRKRDEKFMRIFSELKKKKLDKLSLIVKQNCKTCELIDSMNKDVIYSGDQDLERKHNLDQLKTKKDGLTTESIASSLNIRDKQKSKQEIASSLNIRNKQKSKQEIGQQSQKIKKQEGKTNKKSSSGILNVNVCDKSTQDIVSKADVETNTAEYLAKNPRCSCRTDLCVCKHDLATVLQTMGKGPCCCGFAQCSCRENFYLNDKDLIPTDTEAAPTVSPASEADETETNDNSKNFEDTLEKTEIKRDKDSEMRAVYVPEESLAVKSLTSDKQSLSIKERLGSKTSKSSIIKSSNEHDHEGRMVSKELSIAKTGKTLKVEDDKLAKAKIKNDKDSEIVAEYIPQENQSKKSLSSDIYLSSPKEHSGSKTSKLCIIKSSNEYNVECRKCRCMVSGENQTAKSDKNLKMEDNKTEKIGIKTSKSSGPDDNISKKSQSSKHSLSASEHSGSKIYKLSSMTKQSSLSKQISLKSDSQSKISFNVDETKPRSACDLGEPKQRDCEKKERNMEDGQIKCRPKRSGSQQHHQSFSIPLTRIMTDKDMSVPPSEGNKCMCNYNDCDCEKNIQPDNIKKDASFEKGSKMDGYDTCSSLTKEKCECTSPNKGNKIDVDYTCSSMAGLVRGKCECGYPDCDCEDTDMKFNRKRTGSCICGCGHSLCKCKASRSISNIMKELEEKHSSSKLKISSKSSITRKIDGSKSSLCMCQISEIYKQSSEMKGISEVKGQDSCVCGFPDCDCRDFQTMESSSEEKKSKLEELDEKLKKAEIDYFEKTPAEERFISIGVQCENIDPVKMRERKYCLICGRYDCPCEVKRFIPDSNYYIMSM